MLEALVLDEIRNFRTLLLY